MIVEERIQYLNEYLEKCSKNDVFPGCAYAIINNSNVLIKEFGYAQLVPEKRHIKKNTVFDVASLTKVIATTTSIMILIENGELALNTSLKNILPDYPYENITIKHLLTHTAGYPPEPDYRGCTNREEIINQLYRTSYNSGAFENVVIYSDVGFMLLGLVIDKITGSFKDFANENIFKPLEMRNTCFEPDISDLSKFASTELCPMRKCIVTGVVHDEKAYLMGGTAGHAGLFSTAEDLSKFALMLLNNGVYNSKVILNVKTIDLMSKCWTKGLNETRGLGWITKGTYPSMGDLSSDLAIFHTGFTGTSILIDKKYNTGFILLTNRVHPTRENLKIVKLRCNIHNIALSCIN